MQAHGDGGREIGLADNDRHLIAQALAAAENHEFGLSRPLERHGRAAHDMEIADAVAAKRLDGGGLDPHQPFALDITNRYRQDHDRRQHKRDARQFKNGEIEPAKRGHWRVDAGANLQCEHGDAGEINGGKRDGAGLDPIQAKAAQAGSGEQQARPALAKRLEGRDMPLIQGLDAKHQHMGTTRLDDDGPTCAHFGEGALDRDLG